MRAFSSIPFFGMVILFSNSVHGVVNHDAVLNSFEDQWHYPRRQREQGNGSQDGVLNHAAVLNAFEDQWHYSRRQQSKAGPAVVEDSDNLRGYGVGRIVLVRDHTSDRQRLGIVDVSETGILGVRQLNDNEKAIYDSIKRQNPQDPREYRIMPGSNDQRTVPALPPTEERIREQRHH